MEGIRSEEKRWMRGRKLPGVSRRAQDLHLALPPKHHTDLSVLETVSETRKQEAVTDIT